jgi:hypothetical protein
MDFYDRPDCITLSSHIDSYGTKSGVFLFKNILPKELIEKIEKSAYSKKVTTKYDENLINWYEDKIISDIDGILELWEFLSDILYPTWVVHPQTALLRITPNHDGMFVHSDSPGKHKCNLLSQTDSWKTCCELDYGVVAYLGEFEGGAIYYPNIEKDATVKNRPGDEEDCFEYTPERGDIVIHSAFHPYEHGVRPITSGLRFAFSNFSLKAIDNPGSFYNYKTQEYFDQLGSRSESEIKAWGTPLKVNPQFTKEKIREYQKSGLQGEELAEKFFADMIEE